ncbi:Hpt domain-containing protein [Phenylobacterium soli]|uniref:Hpt domain-containing protein n=1 Tax=Phenylobacterium soli TaxID=2170551 RepID=UPI001D046D1B|nr:Hpt domain-containing protein [Phenylobacterium soli]
MDFAYLERFAAGDRGVVREVLELFLQQAAIWAPQLEGAPTGWRDVAHTIKGAARGVGAGVLGDLCEAAETEGETALPAMQQGLDRAVAEIEAYLAQA